MVEYSDYMLTSYQYVYKAFVFTPDTISVGRLMDFVINPDSGIFEMAWIKTDTGMCLLSFHDIYRWTEEGIFIKNTEALHQPSDLPRIKKVLNKEVPILKASVFLSETNTYLGCVIDFSFDTIFPRLLAITVKRGFLFWTKKRIINAKKIVKITNKGLFIKDGIVATTKKEVKSLAPKNLESSPSQSEESLMN